MACDRTRDDDIARTAPDHMRRDGSNILNDDIDVEVKHPVYGVEIGFHQSPPI